MHTPILDFLHQYAASGAVRLHMPGHKGQSFLGCEALDVTEIPGADSLYEACGVIRESEDNAAALFGSGRTLYSAGGSSQSLATMLYLALANRQPGTPPVVVAARNVHKAYVHAAALLDFDTLWLWPETDNDSLCACPITPAGLDKTLQSLTAPPAAVYITSPDYLGGMADIAALAEICHAHHTVLAVDNAHGAYLRFLTPSLHPLDLGADICCDSAHKTLPVLTGGAYLHIGKKAPAAFARQARQAMALFGSTSPSYLILASLDLCNRYLTEGYPARLAQTVDRLAQIQNQWTANGWSLRQTDPLRLTVAAPLGLSGVELAGKLQQSGVVCEYADRDFLVMMCTPENSEKDLARTAALLGPNTAGPPPAKPLPPARGQQILSPRQCLFSPWETVPAEQSLGRICANAALSCPPA
ncbi:MAG: PLP-dependent transferase, partial [Firmicutes bacterium]|nr:PLP-dependent transferase [Bacillota bacterium]